MYSLVVLPLLGADGLGQFARTDGFDYMNNSRYLFRAIRILISSREFYVALLYNTRFRICADGLYVSSCLLSRVQYMHTCIISLN